MNGRRSFRAPLAAGAALLLACLVASCEEDCPQCVSPTCPVCPSCTTLATVVIEPAAEAYIVDGGRYNYTIYHKDGVGDFIHTHEQIHVSNNASSNEYVNIERRGIVEFHVGEILAPPDTAFLEFVVDGCLNPMYLPCGLALHHYKGDGAIDMNDFLRGRTTVVDTVVYNREWTVSFDVTEAVAGHLAAGDTCVGFNLRMVPETLIDTGGTVVVFRFTETGPPPRLTARFPRANESAIGERAGTRADPRPPGVRAR